MTPEISIHIEPLEDAIRHLGSKTVVGSRLRSAGWQGVPLALRDRAQFSAGVESMLYLNRVSENLLKIASLERTRLADPTAPLMDREEFIAQLREVGLEEGLRPRQGELVDTIQDPTAYRRAKLIFDVQTQKAEGFSYWKTHNDADVIDAAPAQELYRLEERDFPRNWPQRWREASQAAGDGDAYRMLADNGRMIALIASGVWLNLGTMFDDSLGAPFPPFAFNSGMDVRAIERLEAEQLGLVAPGEKIAGNEINFNDALEKSVRDLSPGEQSQLEDFFGGQVTITDGVAKWTGGAA